jgi:hypothetical protein
MLNEHYKILNEKVLLHARALISSILIFDKSWLRIKQKLYIRILRTSSRNTVHRWALISVAQKRLSALN